MSANASILALVIAAINGAAGIAEPRGGALEATELHEIDEGDHAVTVEGRTLTDFEGIAVLGADGGPIGRIDEFLGNTEGRVVGVVLETRLVDPAREVELVVPLGRLHLSEKGGEALASALTPDDVRALGRWPD